MPIRVLLQTTIPYREDDWHVGRFSKLRDVIASIEAADGTTIEVTARDRASERDDDPILSTLAESDFDQLWLFAVDTGDGLTENDCASIPAFRKRGGSLLATRDHQDLGSSLCTIGGVGAAHFFHSHNPDPDVTRRARDDDA